MNKRGEILAAIDIGTNSFHLIVTRINPHTGRFRILTRQREIVRLGSSSSDMKYLSESATNKAIETLRHFKATADAYHAPIRAVATSAVREAANKNEFLSEVKRETGIAIEIASGSEEARLIYLGILQALPVFNETILSIDVGGGSTEFLVGRRRQSVYTNSLKLGAVRLTMKFFAEERLTKHSLKECRKFIEGLLTPVVRDLRRYSYSTVVGTSGTIQNIAKIIRYSRTGSLQGNVNHFSFDHDELDDVVERILKTKEKNAKGHIEGLDPARADIIVAGALILQNIFEECEIDSMVVSDYALREGVILDSIEKKYSRLKFHHLSDIRLGSINHLSEHFHGDRAHADHVARLALEIFDQTTSLHKLGSTEREYLEAAAILHDIGFFISHSLHHLHSYYIVRNAELLGFTENEKEIIANIARYHRKSHPKFKHETFGNLNDEEQIVVQKLAAILRIAEGLDRTHAGAVQAVRCRISATAVTCTLKRALRSKLNLEIWGANWKKGLFEETFGRKVAFVVQ